MSFDMYTSFEDLTDDAAYLFDNTISGHIITESEIDTLIFLNGTTYVASFRDRDYGYLRWVRLTKCQYTYTPTSLYTGAFMDYESPSMVYYRKLKSITDSVAIDYPNFNPTYIGSFNNIYIDENNTVGVELLAYKCNENDYRLLNPYFGYRAIFSYGNTNKNEASDTPASFFDTLNLFMEDPLTKKVIPYYDFKRFRSDNATANGNILDMNHGIIEQGNYYRIYQTYKPEFQTSVYNYESSMLNTAPLNYTSEADYGTITAIYDRTKNKLYTLDTSPSSDNGLYRFKTGVNNITLINGIILNITKLDGTEDVTFYKGFEMRFNN